MTNQTPDLPPHESVGYWEDQLIDECENVDVVLIEAWQAGHKAGADQELEACCEWLNKGPYGASLAVNGVIEQLRAARRPKPPSLKEQALALVSHDYFNQPCLSEEDYAIICRALEALPND